MSWSLDGLAQFSTGRRGPMWASAYFRAGLPELAAMGRVSQQTLMGYSWSSVAVKRPTHDSIGLRQDRLGRELPWLAGKRTDENLIGRLA